MGPGQLGRLHGIAIGGYPPRIFVADQTHSKRINVYDMDGKFLDEWRGFNAYNVFMSADNHLWVVDWDTQRIFKLDLDGHLEYSFGREGHDPGYIDSVHQMSADEEGNLYVAEAGGARTQKFRPKSGADPTKIVWPRPMVPKAATARSSN
jgi:sugar lactone lactonase YvrE